MSEAMLLIADKYRTTEKCVKLDGMKMTENLFKLGKIIGISVKNVIFLLTKNKKIMTIFKTEKWNKFYKHFLLLCSPQNKIMLLFLLLCYI